MHGARGSAASRGYGRRWGKLRKWFLGEHPLCESCKATGKLREAECVDHVIPLARGGTNDETNLQSLCNRCHSVKTSTEDGGFGR